MSTTHRKLLIVACSQRKHPDVGLMPAIERYDGVNYRVIQKLKRDGLYSKNLDVLIISAKYGLIEQDALIENYELRMTSNQALALQAEIGVRLDQWLISHQYDEIFLNVGKVYLLALARSQELSRIPVMVQYAGGGIGKKMSAMKEWLLKISG